jgi:anion-transporting  ArsA/GET3 family ATPase
MGSHEYVAGELLCDFYRKGEFDLIVLDTPPARHALEFFEAPSKVMDFLRSKIISRFLKTYLTVGKTGVKIFKRFGGIFSIIEKLTGANLLLEISEFILFFEGMYEKFFLEAETLYSFLRSNDVSFYLVTSPERERISETAEFRERLREIGIKECGLIINKVNPLLFSNLTQETEFPEGIDEKLNGIINSMRKRAEVQKKIIDGLMKKQKDIVIIPELPEEVHSIEKIKELLPYLFKV